MRIKVLYFGMLKDLLGREGEMIELSAGGGVEDAVRLLRSRASNSCELGSCESRQEDRLWASLALAVNHEYALPTTALKDGDELALLPPVSGGASKLQRGRL